MDNQLFVNINIAVMTQNGKEILKIRFEKTTFHFSSSIDLSGKEKGIYFINLRMEKFSSNRKIIVK